MDFVKFKINFLKLTSLLGGVIYFQSSDYTDNKCVFDQASIDNVQIALFFTVTSIIIISLLSSILTFPLEIPIYQFEV